MYHAAPLSSEPSRTVCIVLTERKHFYWENIYPRDTLRCRGWHFFDCEIFLQILATNLHGKQCREFIKLSLSNAAENFTLSLSSLFFSFPSYMSLYVL